MTRKYRSGESGKYVSKLVAEANKATTQSEVDKEVSFEKAFTVFGAGLKKNGELYEGYKEQIARTIFEKLNASGISADGLHEISNAAADAVLKLFVGEED